MRADRMSVCIKCNVNHTTQKGYKLCEQCYTMEYPKPEQIMFSVTLYTVLGQFTYDIEAESELDAHREAVDELEDCFSSARCSYVSINIETYSVSEH